MTLMGSEASFLLPTSLNARHFQAPPQEALRSHIFYGKHMLPSCTCSFGCRAQLTLHLTLNSGFGSACSLPTPPEELSVYSLLEMPMPLSLHGGLCSHQNLPGGPEATQRMVLNQISGLFIPLYMQPYQK